MNIQWYPGHMTKAKRQMTDSLKRVDAVLEVLDARIPFSSRNPDFDNLFNNKKRIIVLNKADLADPILTQEWIKHFTQYILGYPFSIIRYCQRYKISCDGGFA